MKIHALGFLLILGVIQALADSNALDYIVNSEVSFAKTFSSAVYSYNNNTNVVWSPLSSYLLLAQVTYGADGNTAEQLHNALDLPKNDSFGLEGFKSLGAKLQAIDGAKFYTFNRLTIDRGLVLDNTYSKLIKNIFQTKSELFDCEETAVDIARSINLWFFFNTNKKIINVIYPDHIDIQKTKLIFSNGVHFNAAWSQSFNVVNSGRRNFTDLNEKKYSALMMKHENKFLVYGKLKNINAYYIELPYQNTDFKMVIIVHDKRSITEAEFNELGDELKKFSYKELPKNNLSSEVTLILPKFQIESLINLNPVLKAMKADEIFTDKANFKKLSKNQNIGMQNAEIFQKVVININEEGTGRGPVYDRNFLATSVNTTIVVDVPFYFSIESSQGVLFQGRVLLPNYK